MSKEVKRPPTLNAARFARVRGDNSRGAEPASAINEASGFMRQRAGSCIASRRGRGIRLIILIAPSTPFLCGKCLAFSLARVCVAFTCGLTLCHSRLFALINRRSERERESSCVVQFAHTLYACVCIRGGSHKRAVCADRTLKIYPGTITIAHRDAGNFFPRIAS